ncbi:hypothetical protein HK102_012660, partial [Quaeritorhiza haematococci]
MVDEEEEDGGDETKSMESGDGDRDALPHAPPSPDVEGCDYSYGAARDFNDCAGEKYRDKKAQIEIRDEDKRVGVDDIPTTTRDSTSTLCDGTERKEDDARKEGGRDPARDSGCVVYNLKDGQTLGAVGTEGLDLGSRVSVATVVEEQCLGVDFGSKTTTGDVDGGEVSDKEVSDNDVPNNRSSCRQKPIRKPPMIDTSVGLWAKDENATSQVRIAAVESRSQSLESAESSETPTPTPLTMTIGPTAAATISSGGDVVKDRVDGGKRRKILKEILESEIRYVESLVFLQQ